MSEFSKFAALVHQRFVAMSAGELFTVGVTPDQMWEQYLSSFPKGTNPVFRANTEHDCSCCRNFIKNIGNVVAIVDGKMVSVWDVAGAEYPYDGIASAMSELANAFPVMGLYRSSERSYGAEKTKELREDGAVHTWHHFHGQVAARHFTSTPDKARGDYGTTVGVFKRGLDELTAEAFSDVIELIEQKALYRGEEHMLTLQAFQKLQRQYRALLTNGDRNLFVWSQASSPAARFRNTAIGTLIVDLSSGMEMDAAVRAFESKVAPENYKRPSALITPRMVDDAMKTVAELGLESALERRFAKLSDININNVLWADGSVQNQMKGAIHSMLLDAAKQNGPVPAAAGNATEISIEDFMENVVHRATSMELLVKNTLQPNFMTLTAPVHADVQPLFKWDNNFGWSYDGNITDSIKEKVKRAGGNVSAPLRISLGWFNYDDLDIHVIPPGGRRIYFGDKQGYLDVDMNAGGRRQSRDPVENVAFQRPVDGKYLIIVNNYVRVETDNPGFVIEIENNGSVSQYSYSKAVQNGANVEVGILTVKNGVIVEMNLHKDMVGGGVPQQKWGVTTEQFVKVNTLMLSPNRWDDNRNGNKHWFFVLDGCRTDEPARGIYNEFLKPELETHRKVFEVLGNKTKCAVTDDQLAGVGFSSTRGDSVLVNVTGDKIRKTYNITF